MNHTHEIENLKLQIITLENDNYIMKKNIGKLCMILSIAVLMAGIGIIL